MGIIRKFFKIDPEGKCTNITKLYGLSKGEVLAISDTKELVYAVEG